jgi:hypothetical protein
MVRQSFRLFGYVLLPAAATTFGIHRGLCRLEEKYPYVQQRAEQVLSASLPTELRSLPGTQRSSLREHPSTNIHLSPEVQAKQT